MITPKTDEIEILKNVIINVLIVAGTKDTLVEWYSNVNNDGSPFINLIASVITWGTPVIKIYPMIKAAIPIVNIPDVYTAIRISRDAFS